MKEQILMKQFVKWVEEKVECIGHESKVELFGPLRDAIKVSILFSDNEMISRIRRIGESLLVDSTLYMHETELQVQVQPMHIHDSFFCQACLKVIYYIYEKR